MITIFFFMHVHVYVIMWMYACHCLEFTNEDVCVLSDKKIKAVTCIKMTKTEICTCASIRKLHWFFHLIFLHHPVRLAIIIVEDFFFFFLHSLFSFYVIISSGTVIGRLILFGVCLFFKCQLLRCDALGNFYKWW
jgi:hypothetical protein